MRISDRERRSLPSALRWSMFGLLAGTLTVAALVSSGRGSFRARTPSLPAIAQQPVNSGVSTVVAADPRLATLSLQGSAVSPVLSDGASVWFVLAEGDPPRATLYHYTPSSGVLSTVASFDSAGRLSSLAKVSGGIAVANGERITLVSPEGVTSNLVLAERPRAKDPQNALLPEEIRAMAADDTTLFIARYNVQGIEVVDTTKLQVVDFLPLPKDLAPPASLILMVGGALLVGSPYDFYDIRGGAAKLVPGVGVVERWTDLRPYSLATFHGGVLGTQTSFATPVAIDTDGKFYSLDRALPVSGKEDVLAADGDVIAVAPDGGGVLFVSRGVGQSERYNLPVFQGEPSRPPNIDASDASRPDLVKFPASISSLAVTDDGYIVMTVNAMTATVAVVAP